MYYICYIYIMNKESEAKMDKSIYVKATQEFVDMLNESQWYLKKKPSQIVREAITEYLEKHLPKGGKKILIKRG